MKFEITLADLPLGYSSTFHRADDPGLVCVETRDFYTTDNGEKLIAALDGISQAYLSRLPADQRIEEAKISSLLAIVRRDKTCTLYINELKMVGLCISKATKEKGAPVLVDDVVDVIRVQLVGVSIPEDAGFALVLSAGWRRALFFDYEPLQLDKNIKRVYDPEVELAKAWAYITFHGRVSFSEKQWEEFFKQQWFPFSSLGMERIKLMKNYAEYGYNIDDIQEGVKAELTVRCPEIIKMINLSDKLKEHHKVLVKAIEHFQNGDYLSSSTMIFPRLEGVLRTWHKQVGTGKGETQKNLTESAGLAVDGQPIASGLLLVPKFQEFLEKVYFANFKPENPEDVSRNTVGHGVAPQDKLDLKAAMLGIMILEQVMYLMTAGSSGNVGINALDKPENQA